MSCVLRKEKPDSTHVMHENITRAKWGDRHTVLICRSCGCTIAEHVKSAQQPTVSLEETELLSFQSDYHGGYSIQRRSKYDKS